MTFDQIIKTADTKLREAHSLLFDCMPLRRAVDCNEAFNQIANASNALDALREEARKVQSQEERKA